jgi:hypothetical protein
MRASAPSHALGKASGAGGAEVLLDLADADRNFNHVWSAAANCLPEAHAALPTAAASLENTMKVLDQ